MRFEDFRPTGSICFRFEVKFKSLEAVMVIDAVGEEITARFEPTDEIHFVKVMQVGCYEVSVCQSQTLATKLRRRTISPFPVLTKLLHTTSLDES